MCTLNITDIDIDGQTSGPHICCFDNARKRVADSERVVWFPVVASVVQRDVVQGRQLYEVVGYRLLLVGVSRHQGVLPPVEVQKKGDDRFCHLFGGRVSAGERRIQSLVRNGVVSTFL